MDVKYGRWQLNELKRAEKGRQRDSSACVWACCRRKRKPRGVGANAQACAGDRAG